MSIQENLGYSVKDIDDLIGDEDEEEDGGDEPGDADKDQETEEIADEEQEELESDEDDGKGSVTSAVLCGVFLMKICLSLSHFVLFYFFLLLKNLCYLVLVSIIFNFSLIVEFCYLFCCQG